MSTKKMELKHQLQSIKHRYDTQIEDNDRSGQDEYYLTGRKSCAKGHTQIKHEKRLWMRDSLKNIKQMDLQRANLKSAYGS